MDISLDIHEKKSVDMDADMDGKFHIHGKPEKSSTICHRKRRLSQKSATVAEFGDCRRCLAVFCDSRTFLRQCGQGFRYYVLRLRHVSCYFVYVGHNYDNFIVGLTNIRPTVSTVTLWKYDVCGQYPGAVTSGTTSVSLNCQDCVPPYRYVILQLPLYDHLIVCEVEVLVRGVSNVE